MELHRRDVEGAVGDSRWEGKETGHVVRLLDEDWVRRAFQAGEEVGAQVIDGADEVLVMHEPIREEVAEADGADPGADEALHGLFGRELDKLCAAEGDTADVGEDVVGDDEGDREEEPDHAFEDVVHYEVGLYHNEVESHVCPSKLGELEAVVALLEGRHKEDESCGMSGWCLQDLTFRLRMALPMT